MLQIFQLFGRTVSLRQHSSLGKKNLVIDFMLILSQEDNQVFRPTVFIRCPIFWEKRGCINVMTQDFQISTDQNHRCRNLFMFEVEQKPSLLHVSISHRKFLGGITLPLLILLCPFLVKYFTENNWNLMMLQRSLYMKERNNRTKCYFWDCTFFSPDP